MKTYSVTIIGETPCLMHNDNLKWREKMSQWEKDPANKKISVKGDDRSPACRWIGALYHEGGRLVVPSDNIMTFMREGATKCPTGKGNATFKKQSQSGLVVDQSSWPLLVQGKEVPMAPFEALCNEMDFSVHEKTAEEYGFMLFVKGAKVQQNKHIRVRPRFDVWQASGTITVLDDQITDDVFSNIMTYSGIYGGFGDWRPNSPTSPGPFGKFSVVIK